MDFADNRLVPLYMQCLTAGEGPVVLYAHRCVALSTGQDVMGIDLHDETRL